MTFTMDSVLTECGRKHMDSENVEGSIWIVRWWRGSSEEPGKVGVERKGSELHSLLHTQQIYIHLVTAQQSRKSSLHNSVAVDGNWTPSVK